MNLLLLLALLNTPQVDFQSSSTGVFRITSAAPNAKKCAFGFTAQLLPGVGKSKPLTSKQLFDRAGESGGSFELTIMHYHQSCPYERAIELFGEDRVEYSEGPENHGFSFSDGTSAAAPKMTKKVLVDDEVVYEEVAK